MRFNGPVTLASNVTITTLTGVTSGAEVGDVMFTSTVDADDSTQTRNLTVTAALTPMGLATGSATVTFQGDVGMADKGALTELNVTAHEINLKACDHIRTTKALISRDSTNNWYPSITVETNPDPFRPV